MTESYGKEIVEAIAQIAERSPFQEELSYFLNAAHKHFVDDIKQPAPPLVVLGPSIPEELVCTGGRSPYWVLGGSRASSLWADGDVPRDTDPVSRSSLGYFNSGFGKDSLILVPLVSDSSRKLAYLLKTDGFKVHTFHFPPVKDQFFRTEWERQYESCRRAIAMHLKRPITKRQLKDSAETVGRAKKELQKFLSASADVLPGSIRLFVTNSFYFADDLSLWAAQLESWSARLRHMFSSRMMEKRKVLLLGSPIYFPNYKVPLLIEDAGLEISGQADYSSLQLQSGILGCADGALLMQKKKRTALEATVDAVGRDQQNQILYLKKDADTQIWSLEWTENELYQEPPDPVLDTVSQLVSYESREWTGSPTELAETVNTGMAANALTKYLNVKSGRLLDEYHVKYENRAKHSGRQVKLTYMVIDNVEYEVIE